MPGTASQKIFSFNAREIKEGQSIGRISFSDFSSVIPERVMTVKYVMRYYILKED